MNIKIKFFIKFLFTSTVWTVLSLNSSGKGLSWFCFLEKQTYVVCFLESGLKAVSTDEPITYLFNSEFKLFWESFFLIGIHSMQGMELLEKEEQKN